MDAQQLEEIPREVNKKGPGRPKGRFIGNQCYMCEETVDGKGAQKYHWETKHGRVENCQKCDWGVHLVLLSWVSE